MEGRRGGGSEVGRFLTESLVHHGLLLLFLTLFIHQRTEGVPVAQRERDTGFTSQFTRKHSQNISNISYTVPHLWLLADGRHRNMMTNKMMENRKRQKASSIHSSLQSCRQTGAFLIK